METIKNYILMKEVKTLVSQIEGLTSNKRVDSTDFKNICALLDNYIQGCEYHYELEKILGHDNFSHILADFSNEFNSLDCDDCGASFDQIEQLDSIQCKYAKILLDSKV